jgi:uncharacterized membrane protein YciS (DUF1049 family)
MKLPTRPSQAFRADWFGWGRSATRDVIVLLVVTVLASAVAHLYDLPPIVFQFVVEHADYEVDDLIFVVFVLNIAMLICGVRRYRKARSELAQRVSGWFVPSLRAAISGASG